MTAEIAAIRAELPMSPLADDAAAPLCAEVLARVRVDVLTIKSLPREILARDEQRERILPPQKEETTPSRVHFGTAHEPTNVHDKEVECNWHAALF